ncbi:FG-GAP repeat domain-containing protein [Pendulispora albinea]|uniref:VCBS repeat-containing protein n=1 Tax=Pendulispora albinea TaxID=2741071 RepID=A0ABZ2LKI4_9BACT
MNIQRLGVALIAAMASVSSCRTLPDTGTCGNGIVEVALGEDCDGAATLPGTVCNAACHFSCAPKPEGAAADASSEPATFACPGGYFCGLADNTCRAPSGQFVALESTIPSDAHRVEVADVDDDGFKDLIATSAGLTRVRFSKVDGFNAFADIPNAGAAAPLVTPLTPDSARRPAYLLFPTGQIAIWKGLRDRNLEAIPYPTAVFGGATDGLRVVFLDSHRQIGGALSPGDETFLFAPRSGAGSPAIVLQQGSALTPLQLLRGGASVLAGEVQVGDVDNDPERCPDMVYAFQRRAIGANEPGVELFRPCTAMPDGKPPASPASAPGPVVRFPPVPEQPKDRFVVGNRGVLLADINGDDKLDILVHAEVDTDIANDRRPRVLVAYGAGNGQFRSKPPGDASGIDGIASPLDIDFRRSGDGDDDIFPLAAGQVTAGDSICDFVLPKRVLLRTPRLGTPGSDGGSSDVLVQEIPGPPDLPWQEARIGNFNGDGAVDVVAGSSRTLDFYAGTSQPTVMTPFSHPVLNGAKHFAVGDFDGDQALDVAFASGNEVLAAFGAGRGGPSAPVSLGRFPAVPNRSAIQHLSAGVAPGTLGGPPDGLADLAVVGLQAGEPNLEPDSQFVSMLGGSVHRKLISPFQLHIEGRPNSAARSLMAAAGSFSVGDAHPDIAALGTASPESGGAFTLWNIPLTGDARVITGQVTSARFPLDRPRKLDWKLSVMAALDLDPAGSGPALDEVVIVAPPMSGSDEGSDVTDAGMLAVARLTEGAWVAQSVIDIGGGIGASRSDFRWKVRAADIDDDGAKDLIVLFEDKTEPKLRIFFNTRTGQLGNPIAIDLKGEDILDCTWLHADERSRDPNKTDLAVLARKRGDIGDERGASSRASAVYLFKTDREKRAFLPPVRVDDPASSALRIDPGATSTFRGSIGAGDIDGDGIDDILVATGTRLVVYKGKPR